MLYSCACDDILINSFVAGGYFRHDMRCRMVTLIEKAFQIVRDRELVTPPCEMQCMWV